MNNVYVDIHVLQTVPPSCINRDDTGSPKTAVYGGTTRARISSQAWKHAIRKEFHKRFPNEELGLRTKKIAALVKTELQKLDPSLSDEKAEEKVSEGLKRRDLRQKMSPRKKMSLRKGSYLTKWPLSSLSVWNKFVLSQR